MKSLELNKPHILIVVGLPGTGKTYFATRFGETFGAPFVNYGHFHRLTGSIETGDLVATEMLGQLFLTRQTIIVEGRGETVQDRTVLAKLAHSKGYEILYVWVQTEPQTAKKRAFSSKTSSYTEDEYENYVNSFAPLTKNDPQVVISGKHTYASQARNVLRRIVATRGQSVKLPPVKPPVHTPPKRSGRIIIG